MGQYCQIWTLLYPLILKFKNNVFLIPFKLNFPTFKFPFKMNKWNLCSWETEILFLLCIIQFRISMHKNKYSDVMTFRSQSLILAEVCSFHQIINHENPHPGLLHVKRWNKMNSTPQCRWILSNSGWIRSPPMAAKSMQFCNFDYAFCCRISEAKAMLVTLEKISEWQPWPAVN